MATSAPVINTTGKRPVIDYLTRDYDGFVQAMIGQIPQLLPNWTDRSEADFGIVLIELFAYVADVLSYYQDRVANEAYLTTATQRRSITELLRLIGYQIDPGLSASALIHFDVTADVDITAAMTPYSLKNAGAPGQPDRIFEINAPFSLKTLNSAIDLSAVSALQTGTGAVTIPSASHNLAKGQVIYLEETTTAAGGQIVIRRSPPLTVLSVVTVAAGQDAVTWTLPLTEPYAPASTKLKGNNITATQGQTISNEPIYVGDGTSGQSMQLTRSPVSHLIDANLTEQRRSRPELQITVDGIPWDYTESFFSSAPGDLVYTATIDENDNLTVHFGTGTRGAVPGPGSQVQAVYRIGVGSMGNVGSDLLTVPVSTVAQVKAITNPFNATGGADHESNDEARISGPGSIIAQQRAVTLQDYQLLANAFPGVGKATARVGLRGGYKVVQVYIAPEDPGVIPPPPPSEELRAALKAQLEARQPVNRMAGVDVLNPVYVPVDITVDAYLQGQASSKQVSQDLNAALVNLLSFAVRDFGVPVRVGEVYSALYPVAGVSYVVLQRLARADVPKATSNCTCDFADVPIAGNELAYAGTLTVNLFGGEQ